MPLFVVGLQTSLVTFAALGDATIGAIWGGGFLLINTLLQWLLTRDRRKSNEPDKTPTTDRRASSNPNHRTGGTRMEPTSNKRNSRGRKT